MRDIPFANCFKVDSDLAESSLRYALGQYNKVTGVNPTILWISAWDLDTAQLLCKREGLPPLLPAIDSGYEHDDWSVGTLLHKGVGSAGA